MAYDFTRFSPQSFERLIQSLAAATVGARVQIYGAGKDGAREATYTGRCQIAAAEWDGYVVFQAKHRGTEGPPASNTDWLIRQTDLEMAKFEDSRRSLKRPDYYVMASNVRLSAASAGADGKGQGGIDKVSEHLGGWATKLGFKGSHLWHADVLASLLDAHPGVRTTFDFWVQPGDVLASLLRELSGPDQTETLTKYLRDSLRQSREIKTRDIGQAVGRTVTLDEVFVDLPVNLNPDRTTWRLGPRDLEPAESDGEDESGEYNLTFESDEEPILPSKVLAQLVQHAADTFNPHAWDDVDERDSGGGQCRRRKALPNRVVLLGGPGQGKSTIGQFLAQYLRGRLLDEMKNIQSPETNSSVRAVLKSAESQNIPRTGPLRYPFYVELPRYADLLNEANRIDNHLSIVDYLARDISKGTSPGPSATTVIRWLRTIPSTIIFDGLDEVPHTGNRSDVIRAIEELLDVLHNANADAFIFATSRPQGYQQELAPKYWSHWELDPLGSGDALELASKVALVLVGETTRRTEVLAILADASREEATASLMTSPLQVMLLFHLVATHNNIPKDRWTLFHRHYEILRDREIAKGGAPGVTIRTYRTQIDRIHQDAGYLLHLRAEISGGADAYFTDDEFTALVRSHLERDGFDEQLDELASDIAKLATNRLVFLRSAVEGKVAFDVRSLQEFMASWRLTASPEASIRDRLYEIAGRAHWQLVFKIACSKIYASTGHEVLHHALIGLLDSLDAGDRAGDDRLLLTGSRLAVDLLLDGTMTSVPSYRRKLLSRAMNLISIPESRAILRIRGVLELSQRSLLQPLFIKALNGTPAIRRCMLQLLSLASLDENGVGWVTELLMASWPSDEEVFDIFDQLIFVPAEGAMLERLRAAQWRTPPARVVEWTNELTMAEPDETSPSKELLVCSGSPPRSKFQLRGADGSMTQVAFFYVAMADAMGVDEPPCNALPVWKVARAAFVFSERPSAVTAAGFLKMVLDQDCIGVPLGILLPWPLDALSRSVRDKAACDARICELLAGLHGDREIWERCEGSWTANGIPAPDVRVASDFSTGLLDIMSTKGPPLIGRSFEPRADGGEFELRALVENHPDSAWARSTLLFFAARRQVSVDQWMISFLLDVDLPSMTSSSKTRSYYTAALIRLIPQVMNKAPLLARLRGIVGAGTQNIFAGDSCFNTLVGIISHDPDFRELIPVIANHYLRGRVWREKMALPDVVFKRSLNDTPEIAASVTQLRIVAGHPSLELDTDLDFLFAVEGTFVAQILRALSGEIDEESRSRLLSLCRDILIRRPERDAERAFRFLQNIDEARPVTLRDTDRACALYLPHALATH